MTDTSFLWEFGQNVLSLKRKVIKTNEGTLIFLLSGIVVRQFETKEHLDILILFFTFSFFLTSFRP